MDGLGAATDTLVATNVALGLICLAFLITVGVAVWRDLLTRRHQRPRIPDCWPPDTRTG